MTRNSTSGDGLLSGSIVFGIGILLTNTLGYLYQILMGRMLGPEDYGTFSGLFALVVFVLLAADTFVAVISKHTAEYNSRGENGKVHHLVRGALRKTSLLGLALIVVALLLRETIADYFHLDSVLPVLCAFAAVYVAPLSSIVFGALNGMQRFKTQNAAKAIQATVKLGLGVLFVWFGMGVTGALLAAVVASVVAVALALIALRSIFTHERQPIGAQELYAFFIPTLIGMVSVNLLVSADIILVKHYCTPTDAGYYGALANFGKMIWYGSCFSAWVMFPKISQRRALGQETSSILGKTLGLATITTICGVGLYSLFPEFIVGVVFGAEYGPAAQYLGLVGVIFAVYTFVFIFNLYCLSMHLTGHVWMLAGAAVAEIVGIVLLHDSLQDVLIVMLVTNLVLVAGLGLFVVRSIRGGWLKARS